MSHIYLSPRRHWIALGPLFLILFAALSGNIATAQTTGQPAGSSPPSVRMLEVDSRGFPNVSLAVDVTGLNATNRAGLSPQGLTAADFLISEDGRPVPAENVALTTEQSQGLSLVLLLDQSTEAANWPGIQNAIRALFDTLQPQDYLAAISYNEQTLTLFSFQNDWAASQAILNGISPGGSFSALNPALSTALQLLQSAPTERQAILVIGDSPDNISTAPTFFDTLNQVQLAQVPIYLFGYGAKVQAFPEVQSLSTNTGGQAFISPTSAEIAPALSQLVPTLRSTYRLTYLSQLQADNQSHSVSVSLPGLGATSTAPSQIVATAGTVSVAIPNVSQDQRVGGDVNLTATASAPAPITSVRYLLDGTELLADVDDIGYSIIWDSTTTAPGPHQLEVLVMDSVGNQGQASVQFHVVAPLTVAILLPQPQGDAADSILRVNDEILLAAEISALDGVRRAEFFVGQVLAGTLESAPYRLPFSTAGLEAGDQTITVRVTDSQGREKIESTEFRLAAPAALPAAEPAAADTTSAESSTTISSVLAAIGSFITRSVQIIFYLLLASILGVIAFFGGRWLLTPTPQEPLTTCRFVVANTGNAASHYHLRAEEQTGALSFEMQVAGVPLQPPMLTRLPGLDGSWGINGSSSMNGMAGHRNGAAHLASNGTVIDSFSTAGISTGPVASNIGVQQINTPTINAPNLSMPNVNMPNASALRADGVDMESASDTVDEVMGISRALADVLNTVAYLLPSNLGGPLRSIARAIRRGQMMGRRFQRAQKQVSKLKDVSRGTKTAAGASKVAGSVGDFATAESTHRAARGVANQAAAGVGSLTRGAYAATATGLSHGAAHLANVSSPQATMGSADVAGSVRPMAQEQSIASPGTFPAHLYESRQDVSGQHESGQHENGAFPHQAQSSSAEGWVETPYLMPGQTLTVDLIVQRERKFARDTHVPFRLFSFSADDANAQLLIEDASIQVQGSSWLNRQLTALPMLRATRFATLFLLPILFTLILISGWLG